MCLSTSSLFLIPFLVCVFSLTLFWLISYLFCFQVGSIYKLSLLNLSSSLGSGRILWSDVALPSQFPAALLLDSLSFVLGQLFHIFLLVASGCSQRNSFLCFAPVVFTEKWKESWERTSALSKWVREGIDRWECSQLYVSVEGPKVVMNMEKVPILSLSNLFLRIKNCRQY